jgi:HAMP domain-containing protein
VQQTVKAQQQRTATIQHGIETLFRSYYQQIESLARQPEIQSMNPELQIKSIRNFLEQQKIYFSCALYKSDLTINSVALRNRKDQIDYAPEDFSSPANKTANPLRQAFNKVVAEGEPAFTTYYSPVFAEKMLFVFVPVFDFVAPDRIIGLISCSISLSAPDIHEIICAYPIGEKDILTLTDKDGNLISWQGNLPDNFAGLIINKKIQASHEASPIRVNLASTTYLGTISPIQVMDGFLLAARPLDSALKFLNQLLLDLALVFAVALVIAVAAGYFMSRSLATGIDSLVAGIRQVAKGVISHRVEVTGDDELAEAGNAFNEMVDTLEKHRVIDEVWAQEWGRSTEKSHEPDDK